MLSLCTAYLLFESYEHTAIFSVETAQTVGDVYFNISIRKLCFNHRCKFVCSIVVEAVVNSDFLAFVAFFNHIIHLIAITVLKNVISLDNIALLFEKQREIYSDETAYDYLCVEFENVLQYQFSLKSELDKIGKSNSVEKAMLRSAIIAVAHIIYLKTYFDIINSEKEQ